MRALRRIGAVVTIGALAGLVGPIAAGAANDYGSQPGYPVATSMTTCSGAGAFGAFGPGNNWGTPVGVPSGPNGHGASGPATGSNNANLCGSPQGNP